MIKKRDEDVLKKTEETEITGVNHRRRKVREAEE
jgi:hypothetical protein